ncbi:alpha/beta fold hydrolase [Rubellimicrobium aerolatum]|uniref:Alpha/beta fold hydrolase n=1 Tax=Rubellimicrobium aerolatum TaxID=490979 RepID=A0ABW0S8B0_9RHOB|nr:alpha/beta hydrolase [Rubellimicrobium aerolatum]MBP1804296.1 sigma-B regulation protein RsbQ [Rubellimicrobium aerolatum]
MDLLRRNNVKVLGRGTRPLVFAHGFGCDLNAWRDVIPSFEDDHRVVLFDHVGSGGSDLSAYVSGKYASYDGYVDDVLEVLDALDLTEVAFVGHSAAANMGLLAAIRQPERFSSLVLVAPSPCFIDDGDYRGGFTREDIEGLLEVLDSNFLGWSRAMAPTIMGNDDRPELGDTLSASFCRTDPDIAREFARVVFLSDHRADVPRCRTRSLVLQTQQDMIAPVEVGHFMHRHLPDSELVLMTATGHCPHMSAPSETSEAIRRFLDR